VASEFAACSVTVVIPTIGRLSLRALLTSLREAAEATQLALPPVRVVDDRPGEDLTATTRLAADVAQYLPPAAEQRVLRSGGRGPAAARNVGWRDSDTEWISFLDDDVVVTGSWLSDLTRDLACAPPCLGGSQALIEVPLPEGRRPTDWERGTAGLQKADWITADMAYRLSALRAAGGFDERFPRAFREDADLALAVLDAGFQLSRGTRRTVHPVRSADGWASLRQQRGNADDVLMRRLHGPGWRSRAHAARGRRPTHLLVVAAVVGATLAAATGRRRTGAVMAAGWLAGTAEFSFRRIAPGPKNGPELARMISTSVLIPPAATWHWLTGLIRHRHVRPRASSIAPLRRGSLPAAVLLDRDDTLIRDVPYNGDPSLVEAMPGARLALDRLRAVGVPLAVITNQSAIGRGLLEREHVEAVNDRVEELLGPFDAWAVCPHVETDACDCRKPLPGMIYQVARQLNVDAQDCVVIGDIGSDIEAAAAASARGILIPTAHTRECEVHASIERAVDLSSAVALLLDRAWSP
jgi:HAD superfamily hydrolase (TIGR01662 family)